MTTSGTADDVAREWDDAPLTTKQYGDGTDGINGFYGMTFMTTQDATVDTALVAYIKQVYSGDATEAVTDPNGKDATFFVQLDVDTS